jgi:hypothetical protein
VHRLESGALALALGFAGSWVISGFRHQSPDAIAQERAARSQEVAAEAGKRRPNTLEKTLVYLLWPVIVLALSSFATAFFSAWDHWFRHP